jgi:hypothetical protein
MALNFPDSPIDEQIYTDPNNAVWRYDANKNVWNSPGSGSRIIASDTAPSSPVVGDLWFDSSRGITYIYYFDGSSNQWVTVTAPSIEAINLTGDVTAAGYGDNLITTIEPNAASGFVGDSVTGEATFQNEFNRILLSDVHLLEGLEVGDVIEVTGSNNGDNDKAFTVTLIGVNEIEVNDAHKNKTWTTYNRSLQEQTPTAGVTVTLACKAKNASLGYGQAWVGVGADRGNGTFGVISTNSIGRAISVAVSVAVKATVVTTVNEPAFAEVFVDEQKITQAGVDNTTDALNRMTPVDFIVPSGSNYRVDASDPGGLNDLAINMWKELR